MNPLFLYKIYAIGIVPASALLPIFFGIKNYRALPPAFRILLTFIIVSSLFNLANLIAVSVYHIPTLKWIHVYTILEFTFVALVFSRVFSKKWRVPIYVLILLFAAACAFDSIFIQNKMEFNTYTRPVGALVIVTFCMAYIIKTGTTESKWTDNNFNWINIGLLLYYSAGLVMFTFSNYFLQAGNLSLLIWTVHNTILLVEYILFSAGFSKFRSLKTAIV